MGLDCSHGAFNGPYSRFNRFRQAVGAACNVQFPPHQDKSLDPACFYLPDGFRESNPGLTEFFSHEDCDGDISPENCQLIANEMDSLYSKIACVALGDYSAMTRQFIEGCRRAAKAGEPLLFR